MIRRLLSLICIALALPALASELRAQNDSLPTFSLPPGPTNVGKEFWLSFPSNWDVASVTTKYIRLYITSNVRTSVDIYVGTALMQTLTTVPFDIVTYDLASTAAQVVVRDDQSPVPPDQVYTKRAIHIVSRAPIVVYGLNRTSFTTDGLLALPTNALGREYVVASAADIGDQTLQKLPSQFVIIAPHDNTIVSITNPMSSPNHAADSTFTVAMNKGDVFSSMSSVALGDLSGALITANKPVAVTAGQSCTYLPDSRYCCCDHLEEMLLPVSAWGKFYHSVPYSQRVKGDMYRIFAGEDDAKIYINGILYATLSRKGGAEGVGWVEYLPAQRGAVEISSDKRIAVAQYNNSQAYDNTQTDPFYIMLLPMEQYQKQIVFSTPTQDYVKNFINLVSDSAAYNDLEIAPGGTGAWEKVAVKYPQSLRSFPTLIGGKRYVGATLEIAPGTYRLRGSSRFAAYIYGSSAYDSYGYPLAAQLKNHSADDEVPPEIAIVSKDSLGAVSANVTDQAGSSSERSNLSTIDLDPTMSRNYALTVTPFDPGISSSTSYSLSVLDRSKDADAVVIVTDMAGNESADTVHFAAAVPSSVTSPAADASTDAIQVVSGNPTTGDHLGLIYETKSRATVMIELFDVAGHLLLTPAGGKTMDAGRHSLEIPIQQLSAGRYFVRLTVDGVQTNRQVVIAR